MSDERDDDAVPEDPKRPDPRLRPPDPAGTQPKWDPDELLPQEKPPAAHDRLWSPPGEGEAEGDREVAAPAPEVAAASGDDVAASAEPLRSRYSGRFHFILGALLACGAAAVTLFFAALLGGSSSTKTITLKTLPAWSKWKPTAVTGSAAAQQIATHVSQQYHLPDRRQLVLASGGPLSYASLPASLVIKHPDAQGGNIETLDGVAAQYKLCAIDPSSPRARAQPSKSCVLSGRPSVSRAQLLKREAVELALYSFRYLGVTQTVVLMPPTVVTDRDLATGRTVNDGTLATALLFQRDAPGVATAITRPLSQTLSDTTPTLATVTRSPDRSTVDTLASSVYAYRFTLSETDGSAYLVLQSPTG
ncbi:hypothetical protein [Conexibacter woesei]|uniref:hypothetical protein n=1 Tax=Conexibacter woesei TaxID=191495 RepID=UPI0004084E74|nr:hypothetical protein [Conexibacter woesei]